MPKYFDIKITSGTSPGPYTVYYDVIDPAYIATLYDPPYSPATNLTYTQLTTGTGVRVSIPDGASSAILYNQSCGNTQYGSYNCSFYPTVSFPKDPVQIYIPPPVLKYDQYSSSYNAATQTWINLGSGGSTYNLGSAVDPVEGGLYVRNAGSVNSYLEFWPVDDPRHGVHSYAAFTGSGVNLYQKDFTISIVIAFYSWARNSYDYTFGNYLYLYKSDKSTYFNLITTYPPTDPYENTAPTGSIGVDVKSSSSSGNKSYPDTTVPISPWYGPTFHHVVYSYKYSTNTLSCYRNNTLKATVKLNQTVSNMTTPYLDLGSLRSSLTTTGIRMGVGALTVWPTSALTNAQIDVLYSNEYKSRFNIT